MRVRARAFTIGWIVLALSVAGCGSTSDGSTEHSEQSTPEPGVRVVEATIEGSEIVTASRRVDVTLDESVRLVITADVDNELHVHGYDLTMPIPKGKTVTLEFVASIPGVFEVELEQAGLVIVELKVQ